MLGIEIFFGILFILGGSSASFVDLSALDDVLAKVQVTLQEEGKDALKLSDLMEPFEFNVYGKSLQGQFSASDGVVLNISTIHRVGLVSMTENSENSKTINATVKFEPLEFYYKNYKLKYLSLDSQGAISITRPQNYGTIQHTITKNADLSCNYTTDFSFQDFGIANTSVTGSTLPEQFLPFINSWIIHSFATNEINDLQKYVATAITKNLEKDGPLCKNLFGGSK